MKQYMDILYICIKLDDKSKNELKAFAQEVFGEDGCRRYFCDHLTLAFGRECELFNMDLIGTKVKLKVDTIAYDEKIAAAVVDMEVGQVVDIHLMPEEAYGQPDPQAIFTVEIEQMPGAENVNVGEQVYLTNAYGQPFPVKVAAKDDTTITFDANHEMAGKELNFRIELVEVLD